MEQCLRQTLPINHLLCCRLGVVVGSRLPVFKLPWWETMLVKPMSAQHPSEPFDFIASFSGHSRQATLNFPLVIEDGQSFLWMLFELQNMHTSASKPPCSSGISSGMVRAVGALLRRAVLSCGSWGAPCNVRMTFAVAVPDGKVSFSLMMVCVRRGTAQNTPMKARDSDQSRSWPNERVTAPPGFPALGVMIPRAGMTPTSPTQHRAGDLDHLCVKNASETRKRHDGKAFRRHDEKHKSFHRT